MPAEPSLRRVIVTGSTGYIGSQLIKRLVADGTEVHVIVRSESDRSVWGSFGAALHLHVHDGSTDNLFDIVARSRPEVVFHLASLFLAQHDRTVVTTLIQSNILFATQLVEAMAAHGADKLVNTGTSWQHHCNEPCRPVNLYAATKQAFEDILSYYCDARGLKAITLSLFDTYGPNDPRRKLIPLLWQAATLGTPLDMSPGEQLIDIVYVDDVTRAFVVAGQLLGGIRAGHRKYGIASGRKLRLKELVSEFEQATGLALTVRWGQRPYRDREVMDPWTNYEALPGWQPEVSFAEGLALSAPSYLSSSWPKK